MRAKDTHVATRFPIQCSPRQAEAKPADERRDSCFPFRYLMKLHNHKEDYRQIQKNRRV